METSPIVVYGKIVTQDPPIRIEFDDGTPIPVVTVRTTFYVQAEKVFKGNVKVGDLVPFWDVGGEVYDLIIINPGMPDIGLEGVFYIRKDGSTYFWLPDRSSLLK